MAPTTGSRAYAEMVADYVARGFDPNIITFMFRPLHGSACEIEATMNRIVETVYRIYLPRVVRNPCAPSNRGRLPLWFLAPDLPVYKRAKQSLEDILVNGGLHVQGHALDSPYRRCWAETLFDHFSRRTQLYGRLCPDVARTHVQPITDNIPYVSDYLFKSLARARVDPDSVLILPRTIQEMKGKDTRTGRISSIFGPV